MISKPNAFANLVCARCDSQLFRTTVCGIEIQACPKCTDPKRHTEMSSARYRAGITRRTNSVRSNLSKSKKMDLKKRDAGIYIGHRRGVGKDGMKNSDAKALLDEINKVKFKKVPFVSIFLQDITRIISSGTDLTKKQGKVLESIYRDTQGGGMWMK